MTTNVGHQHRQHHRAAQRNREPERRRGDRLVPPRHDQPGHVRRHVRQPRPDGRQRDAGLAAARWRTRSRRAACRRTRRTTSARSRRTRSGRRSARCSRSRRSTSRSSVTSAATSITSTTAQLNGTGNPNGASATAWFRLFTSDPGTCNDTTRHARLRRARSANLGSGRAAVGYTFNTNTTIVAARRARPTATARSRTTPTGRRSARCVTFTTPAVLPSVSTGAATLVTSTTATINGSGIPGGATTTAWFRYSPTNPGGCSDTFGTRVPAMTGGTDLGAGNTSVPFSQALTGLTPGTTYYYCAIASNSLGTVFGGLASFTTPSPPTVTTNAASGVGDTTATLVGTANPNGDAATGWFRYSTTNPATCDDMFGTRVPASGGTDLGAEHVADVVHAAGQRPDREHDLLLLRDRVQLARDVVRRGRVVHDARAGGGDDAGGDVADHQHGAAERLGQPERRRRRPAGSALHDRPGHVQRHVRARASIRAAASTSAPAPAGRLHVQHEHRADAARRARPTTTARSRTNSFGTSFGAVLSFTTPAAPPTVIDRLGDRRSPT